MLQILTFLHSEVYLCFDLCDDFLFSGMAVSPPPSQYINVEPEEERMYSGEGDTTIHAI